MILTLLFAAAGIGAYSTDNGIPRYFESYPIRGTDVIAMVVSADVHPDTGLPVIVLLPFTSVPYVSYDLGTMIESNQSLANAIRSKWNTNHFMASDKLRMDYLVDNSYIEAMTTGKLEAGIT